MPSIEHPIIQSEPQEHAHSNPRRTYRPALQPYELGQALDDCLEIVEAGLGSNADIENARMTLDALAAMIQADETTTARWDYVPFLRRLTRLYADGCEQRGNRACLGIAAAYAGVIEAISHKYPAFDFTDAFGQLLECMTRLFSARDNSWKIVYKHLRAVPDAIGAKQNLNRVCSADISEWFDAGVQNLFSLHRDLSSKLQALELRAEEIEEEIRAETQTLEQVRRRVDPQGTGKVVALEGKFMERRIAQLQEASDAIEEERDGRESTRGLIESDILQFEGLLREARRSYYLHLV